MEGTDGKMTAMERIKKITDPNNPTESMYINNGSHGPYKIGMMDKFNSFRDENKFCDITISIGGELFHAHKMVLSASSGYFESMLSGPFVESSKSVVEIEGDAGAFKILLQYAYSGKLEEVHEDTIVTVLNLACYMLFDNVIRHCSQKLYKFLNDGKISCEDSLTLAKLATSFGYKDPVGKLLRCTVRALTFKFTAEFMRTATFLEGMSAEVFQNVLLEPVLVYSAKEEEVLKGMISWLSHDMSNRKQHAATLVKMLRLGVIPDADLRKACEFFDKHFLSKSSDLVKDMRGLQTTYAESDDRQEMFTPRNIVTGPLAIGGDDDNTIVYFDNNIKFWATPPWKFPTLPTRTGDIMHHASIVVDDELYVAGGIDSFWFHLGRNKPYCLYKQLWKYDPDSNSWMELASMKSVRREFAFVHLDGFLYAIGGKIDLDDATKRVECYDLGRNKWKCLAPLRSYYSYPSAVVWNGKILVYGKQVDRNERSLFEYALEMYDPAKNKWQKLISEKYWKDEDADLDLDEIYDETPLPMISVQDGKCYRIAHDVEYDLEESEGEVSKGLCVNEIIINENKSKQVSAVIGKEEKQLPLKCDDAFCMNGKVFIYLFERVIYNTGIDVNDIGPDGLDTKWRRAAHGSGSESVVTFTFDILKLKPKL